MDVLDIFVGRETVRLSINGNPEREVIETNWNTLFRFVLSLSALELSVIVVYCNLFVSILVIYIICRQIHSSWYFSDLLNSDRWKIWNWKLRSSRKRRRTSTMSFNRSRQTQSITSRNVFLLFSASRLYGPISEKCNVKRVWFQMLTKHFSCTRYSWIIIYDTRPKTCCLLFLFYSFSHILHCICFKMHFTELKYLVSNWSYTCWLKQSKKWKIRIKSLRFFVSS